ncbi:MAG: PTS system mannose/fructose/sorbose family transporter subunit IID [bacterium]|nr:PTS system mannose/fructose/sorbose family transporter subunit IID [bacterium]
MNRPKKTNILLRSLALQLFLNYKTMQGPGYLFALKPDLTEPDENKVRAAASLINGHPVFSSIALGAIAARLRVPVDEAKAKEIAEWKRGLSTPLGAIGDSLIWERFKPALLAIVVATMIVAGQKADSVWGWCAFALLLIYNLTLWSFRSWGFSQGFKLGERVSELALHPALPVVRKALRVLGIVAAAFVLATAGANVLHLGQSAWLQFGIGFLFMLGAVFLRYSTLTVAFLTVLSSLGIAYLFSSTPLLP